MFRVLGHGAAWVGRVGVAGLTGVRASGYSGCMTPSGRTITSVAGFTVLDRHWYKQFVGECPVCGADKSYRVRVYGDKPVSPLEWFVNIPDSEAYDWCDL